jgi:hypothetical protein
LGYSVVQVDPPRARRDPLFHSDPPDALRDCDVLTLHVPLDATEGPDRTLDWLDARRIAGWRRPFVLLNAARGPVVDQAAVVGALKNGMITSVCADVFRDEPTPAPAYVRACALATPHVAGRSRDGRRGLQQRTLAAFSGWARLAIAPLPDLDWEDARFHGDDGPNGEALPAFLERITGFAALDAALKADPRAFRSLRAVHARRDWRRIRVPDGPRAASMARLGFAPRPFGG